MSGLLKALELLANALAAWLRKRKAEEIQESNDANHADPQKRFAERFSDGSADCLRNKQQ